MTEYLKENEQRIYQKLFDMMSRVGGSQPVIFDVGANIGQSIDLFREHIPTGVIHSFEPNPAVFKTLEESRGELPNLILNPLALSDQTIQETFYATKVDVAGSLMVPDPKLRALSKDGKYDYDVIDVSSTTIDSYCQQADVDYIDVLKLDVQGAELKVLKGALDTLKNGRIGCILLEAIFAETYSGQWKLVDMLSLLDPHGFEIWDFLPACYTRSGRLWYSNLILVDKALISKLEDTK